MKISIVTAAFPPEPIVSAQTSAQIAAALQEQKHSVTVITNFPNRPAGILFSGYKRTLLAAEADPQGFVTVRCFSIFSRASSLFSRWLENISFGITSSLVLLFSLRPDVVYLNTWPIFATGLSSLVCKFRRIPFVVHVKDVYPESLHTQGRLKPDQGLYKLLLFIDRWVALHANSLIVLSESFARGYTQVRNISPSKIHILPDWIDSHSTVALGNVDYRLETGIPPEAFVLVYGGNIGVAAGVGTIIEALRRVNSNREIVLVIAGSGSQLAVCQNLASSLTKVRVIFISPWDSKDTFSVLSAADVLILPTQGSQSLSSVPSKLLSYLLAGRPVLAAVLPESDTARVINVSDCGWVIHPNDIEGLARKIEELISLPRLALDTMGFAGRRYAMQNFSPENVLPKVIGIIEKALWDSQGPDLK